MHFCAMHFFWVLKPLLAHLLPAAEINGAASTGRDLGSARPSLLSLADLSPRKQRGLLKISTCFASPGIIQINAFRQFSIFTATLWKKFRSKELGKFQFSVIYLIPAPGPRPDLR